MSVIYYALATIFCIYGVKSDLLAQEDYSLIRINANYDEINTVFVNDSVEYVFVYPHSSSIYPFRVNVWSRNSNQNYPVLVAVRQQTEIISWQIPLLVESRLATYYSNTSRTLCHPYMDVINQESMENLQTLFNSSGITYNFLVSVSTSDVVDLEVGVQAIEETEFYVQKDENRSLTISPSQPEYVYYKFTDADTDSVIIDIDSADDVCLTVSVQDSSCPVLDLNKDIRFSGKYSTINKKGGIMVLRSEFRKGFFLVFVAKGDNYECSSDSSIIPMPRTISFRAENRTSVVTFTVKSGISLDDYVIAASVTLSVIGIFAIISIILTCAFVKCGKLASLLEIREQTDSQTDEDSQLVKHDVEVYLSNSSLCVKQLSTAPERNKRKTYNYLWHVASIALFYSIPVVQLVITYQRVVNISGNQDLCYYNFLCANPGLYLNDFNHVFSNIGYILIGALYLLMVMYRQSAVRPLKDHGIPVHYGFLYAMGVALIIEGLLSACYHICPSQSNYQFDLSFMYIMAVLIMVKLYHNRHPDINATAYNTFAVIGVGIFAAMIGILNGSLWIWIVFVVIYMFFCIYISFKIYFISYVMQGFKKFKNDLVTAGLCKSTLAPVRKARFIILIIANVLNYTILALGVYSYFTGSTDFGTFLLMILMANAVLHASFYIAMKIIHKEKVCAEAAIFGILAVIIWGISGYFFLDYSTLWTLTPAESRQRNKECSLLNFYDSHDIWHILSSAAMFLTFMFLLNLDDDLVMTPQEDIAVF